jgi:hypothetical protein
MSTLLRGRRSKVKPYYLPGDPYWFLLARRARRARMRRVGLLGALAVVMGVLIWVLL